MLNPILALLVACALLSSITLGAAVLVYARIHTRTRQRFPQADIPPMSRFKQNNERLTLSLYRGAFPHSPLLRVYHALLWIAAAAFFLVLFGLLVIFVRQS